MCVRPSSRSIAVVNENMSFHLHYWTNYVELYFQKVIEIARLNRQHFVKMMRYCKESDSFSRMLVFEYQPNGTLYEHFHDSEGCQLSWLWWVKIAPSIAHILRHIHTEL
ncbi:hypothetical protein ACQ4PT_044498 [Festuca glaucescens]